MYDGAGIAELSAGLRCLDFLSAKSKLSEPLMDDIANTVEQADIRIDLLARQPSSAGS